MAWHAHTLYGSHTSHNNRHSARRATALYMQGCSVGGGVEGGGVEGARVAASRAAAEGGGDKGSSGATRAAAICMRAAGRRGWQRRGPRAAATSAATWRRATPATLTRAVAKATPRGLQVRSNSKSCAPIQPTSDCWTCRNLCCSARRPGCETGQHDKGVGSHEELGPRRA